MTVTNPGRPERRVVFGLRWKFLLFVSVGFVLTGAIFGWIFQEQFDRTLRTQFEKRGQAVARGLAVNARLDLWSGDQVRLERLVSGALEQADVIGTSVFDQRTAALIASVGTTDQIRAIDFPKEAEEIVARAIDSATGPGVLVVFAPVVLDRTVSAADNGFGFPDETNEVRTERQSLGAIGVAFSLAQVEERISSVAETTMLTTLGIVAGGIVIVILLSRIFVTPIERIAATARKIADGDRRSRAYVKSRDEIGVLADSFNSMTETLAGQELELRNVNANLELKVTERTSELELKATELRVANAELERASRLKSEFLANMSHELRTPLNAINGFSELLLEGIPGDVNEKQKRYLTNIHSSGVHLLGLINNILDLSKIEAGRMELRLEDFQISEVVDTAASVIQPLAQKKNLALEVEISPDLGMVHLDQAKTRQVLFNLMSNAVKFTDEGTVTVFALPAAEGWFELGVQDSGIGIPLEDQPRVFREFEQVDGSHSRKYEGTGLGLALTKRMVEMQGGTMRLESEVGKGSRFVATLPYRGVMTEEESSNA